MFKVTKYPHGTFSWADCSSTDWAGGKQFYADVFGWETEDLPMGEGTFYTMFKQDGENVGAINPMQAEMQAQGVPSHWMNYITVDDVDALVDKVTEFGGTVVAEPFDVFDDGRMMIIQEPTGATVALWQAKNTIGAGLVNTVGAMLWNELLTRDPQKAMDFFNKLLGWEYQQDGERDYLMIVNKGRMNGGILNLDDSMPGVPSHFMAYYNVADLEESLEKVKAGGGAVHIQAEAEGVGKFAMIADPQGAMLYLMQADNVEEWVED
ncbi:MAG: VOC family protein [Phototrophicaceae bacterium]